ncbi:adenylate/guanylate cyclase domain-containing protein [Microvirga aerophila]|uniref:Adenylate class-3/4/guanylyl cyclase n=1 Tax=Microvirga aerophila TaxID=670291 RepID=A0A512BV75_9HYPH|nr:adenylate/guanylate cyclase domain-containing protein [Microvirga aerophila]GEO15861.1 adenylate class-3/4/guanylyl cyclase [Microvirga aerophila]
MARKEHKIERRLAAIFAADVANYSRLMEQDEVGTLHALTAHRQIMSRLIAEHGGRIANTAGDSVLAEFPSAVDAVQCAIAVQAALAQANLDIPDEQRVRFRLGVHVGDVMVQNGDLMGDGVNIAARLESLAEPGGVCISGTAHAFVRKVLPLAYNDLGSHVVKNMEEPVQVYHVADPTIMEHKQRRGKEASRSDGGRLTIAVMPFANLSDDPAQQYFSDGITEDIITDLSRFHELTVRAKSSTFGWRDRNVDGWQLKQELGVDYIVEGSVRRLGDRLRITAQLTDAISGNHLWSERFDRTQQHIFAIQDEIVRVIVASLVGRLGAAGAERAKRKPPASLAAYECVLHGRSLPVVEPEAEAEARRLYERALELDPNYAQAHARLAYLLTLEWWWEMSLSQSLLDRALGLAKKAVALDQHDRVCHDILGWVYLHWKAFDLAEQHKLRALELNPCDPEQIAGMGVLYTFLGRADEGIAWLEQAKRIDPYFDPAWWWNMVGVAHFVASRYDEALAAFRRSSSTPVWAHAYQAACCALLGQMDRARDHAAEVLNRTPDFSLTCLATKELLKRPEDTQRLVEGMQAAGLPE